MAVISGQTTVTSAGERVQLAEGVRAKLVFIGPNPDNTGNVFVGGSTVSSSNGAIFAKTFPGLPIEPPDYDLDDIYVDAASDGDKVWWEIMEKAP